MTSVPGVIARVVLLAQNRSILTRLHSLTYQNALQPKRMRNIWLHDFVTAYTLQGQGLNMINYLIGKVSISHP